MNTTSSNAPFSALHSASLSEVSTMLRDLCRTRRHTAVAMRIGRASVGRILTLLMQMLLIKVLPAGEMLSVMNAVITSLSDPGFIPDGDVDGEIFGLLKAEIDKSEIRSQKARERAARRKAERAEAAAEASGTSGTADGIPPGSDGACPVRETAHVPDHDPDVIVSNYKPPKKPLPRYRVLSDEEMNAKPYDPFGFRRAYEIQCGPLRRGRRW